VSSCGVSDPGNTRLWAEIKKEYCIKISRHNTSLTLIGHNCISIIQ
jgi:hypothetical protein